MSLPELPPVELARRYHGYLKGAPGPLTLFQRRAGHTGRISRVWGYPHPDSPEFFLAYDVENREWKVFFTEPFEVCRTGLPDPTEPDPWS